MSGSITTRGGRGWRCDTVAEHQVDGASTPSKRLLSRLLQRAVGKIPATIAFVFIEGTRLVGDGLRGVALLHDVIIDKL
jgi:hypothetical protein